MKKYLLWVICLLFSCTSKTQNNSQANVNEVLVRKYFDYFNQHDWAKMAAMYTDTADFKDPSLGLGIIKQTRQQTIQKYSQLAEIFPNLHDEIKKIYPSGNEHIIIEFVSTGSTADGRSFELPVCTIFTIKNGLITKDFTYFDNFEE